jgi:C4-dicarboxylate transporter, DctM subunit
MDPYYVGVGSVIALAFLLACGVPVAVCLGATGLCGLTLIMGAGAALSNLQTLSYSVVANYSWAVLPLFVLMGNFASESGMTEDLFNAAHKWLGRMRGGLYHTVIVGSAGFAAASGSTVVNAVVFTRLALPEMIKHGYSRSLTLGCIACAGTFAAMIPPSLTMVIYCIITEQSIGKLMMAGFLPGILTALLYMLLITFLVRVKPSLAPKTFDQPVSWGERFRALKGVWGVCFLVTIVLGGIYAGFFAPSAAGAVGAFGTLAIAAVKLGLKRRDWLMNSLRDSATVASTIFIILIGGLLYSRLLTISGVITGFTVWMSSTIQTPTGVLIAFSLLYIALGCLLDTASMMIITLPFVFPIVEKFGINPIWFGILFVKLIEISVVTPPVGLNLFAVMSAAGKECTFRQLVAGVLPFLGMEIITLTLLIIFPEISLWLPDTMLGK